MCFSEALLKNYSDLTADREVSLGMEPKFGNALRELIADPNWQALFTFRIGYPTIEALNSPRRSVQEVVVSYK
jgi:hypothetical protein